VVRGRKLVGDLTQERHPHLGRIALLFHFLLALNTVLFIL